MGASPCAQLRDDHINPQHQPVTGDGHGPATEEVRGLIRLYRDGHVERLPAVASVPPASTPDPDVVCEELIVAGGLTARLYLLPKLQALPLLVYFHGGGFCVGSVAWRCYHEFAARLAARANCAVLSVDYRLAPEHPLPAAYEDGLGVLQWATHRASGELARWRRLCDFSRVFLAGDSAGAAIAYHAALKYDARSEAAAPLRGAILIQPFFGGAARTWSETNQPQSSKSALSLATSDCYWRMALPAGADRDHRWCNPLAAKLPAAEASRLPALLVCDSELDILKDRSREFCKAMSSAGVRVEQIDTFGFISILWYVFGVAVTILQPHAIGWVHVVGETGHLHF
ncbi:hypothetical protein ZIOFF_048736 [Zingiber officinale]|uniref:Alpha/beta hydrolase fold-3 domain-containing protein n=1 Tax=Zingiber officinale TaxID=94328 RepID=A0A8J5G869_ZINOF|nr:hypothetical protein ZIOFF_048736 [Zingiber officinale]